MAYRVLVVDDEVDVRRAMQALLEEEIDGVQVSTAPDGPTGLRLLGEDDFDLILADYRMPDMDGLTFVGEARRRFGPVPTLIVTAYPDPGLAARAVGDIGVGLIVAKPMDLDYFVAVVRALLMDPREAGRLPRVFSP